MGILARARHCSFAAIEKKFWTSEESLFHVFDVLLEERFPGLLIASAEVTGRGGDEESPDPETGPDGPVRSLGGR